MPLPRRRCNWPAKSTADGLLHPQQMRAGWELLTLDCENVAKRAVANLYRAPWQHRSGDATLCLAQLEKGHLELDCCNVWVCLSKLQCLCLQHMCQWVSRSADHSVDWG